MLDERYMWKIYWLYEDQVLPLLNIGKSMALV
jgi:hypothetical protein